MKLEIVIFGGKIDSKYFCGYKNLFSSAIHFEELPRMSDDDLELYAFKGALKYLLGGTHRSGTIYLHSKELLDRIHNPEAPKFGRVCSVWREINELIQVIISSGKQLNILKSKTNTDYESIRTRCCEYIDRSAKLAETKRRNILRGRARRRRLQNSRSKPK